MSDNSKPLKLVSKCYDPIKYKTLYGFNQEVSDELLSKAKPFMTKFTPALFENVMAIQGDPHGWMCTREDAPKVESAVGITETLEKIEEKNRKQREYYDKHRKAKEDAQLEIESMFFDAPRPPQKLSTLLRVADTVYDPANSFRDNQYYGGGYLFIITKTTIWFILNNGREENNWKINNIEIEGAGGAIGFKLPYSDKLHDLIKTLTESNEYEPNSEVVEGD